MKNTIIGIAVAAVVLYMWGFVYWGLGQSIYGTMIWNRTADDVAAGEALRQHFPADGTYYVPGFDQDQQALEARFKQGPVAFVHMLAAGGREAFDPSIMIQGFVLNLVFIVLLAFMLRQVCSGLPAYADRVKFTALAGLTAAVLIDIGDAVWWQIDWGWKLYNAVYDFSAFLITGLILAKFIAACDADGPAQPEAASESS